MEYNVYTIRDNNAEYYLQPLFARNDNEAKRIFGMAVKNPDTMISQYPSQFELFHIGTWNEVDASITPCDRKYLCCGLDFAGKEE